MKTTTQPGATPETSRPDRARGAGDSAAGPIDTSRMSEGQRAAMELAESSRDPAGSRLGFAASIFWGRPDWSALLPFPEQSIEDRDQGDAFLARLGAVLRHHTDPDEIDRSGDIPDSVIHELARIGAFGIKIPASHDGLGLSQTNYARAAMRLGRHCGNLTALLSAHQSIGVPQPLMMFGTPEQKRRYLPRCARGEISAFALTETEAGSDPARMTTTATPDPATGDYILNGSKLWCTNGMKAGLLVVMARTPTEQHPRAISAFIVETSWPGVSLGPRCHFMGLRALYNGVIDFDNVRVPAANLVGGFGKGLKVALSTLNTGRITLPAACAGLARHCAEEALAWAALREQWGRPIARHAAISAKLASMQAGADAIEAMVRYVCAQVDAAPDHSADIRIEAALAKLWGTERAWQIVNDTMQVRGGRGYETAASLRARGEPALAVERFLRDSRINTIFEGSTEIMHLFIAREVLDPHLRRGAAVFDSRLGLGARLRALLRTAAFYSAWYPARWLPRRVPVPADYPRQAARNLRWIDRQSRRLARATFHSMMRHGPKLDRRQLLLGRLVNIGAELFVLATASARLGHQWALACLPPERRRIARLLDLLHAEARRRLRREFAELHDPADNHATGLIRDQLGPTRTAGPAPAPGQK